MSEPFEGARWIARTVPASQRVIRQITRTRVDWAEPGHALAQSFTAQGPVTAVNIDLVGPGDAVEAHGTDVRFVVSLERIDGETVVERVWEGPQLVWDYFGPFLDVAPPAPPGQYRVVLRVERGRVGWSTGDEGENGADDGVSPRPVEGSASADGAPVTGTRLLGVDTMPAPNPVFRRVFTRSSAPVEAALSAVALGTGVVRVNGHRVGDEMLEPAVTDYDKTILYRTWDVAHLLRAGENTIEIHAGRERYAARGGDTWGWHLAPWHREPTVLARLDTVDADGRSEAIVTDATWETAPGPVVAERLFRGEDWVVPSAIGAAVPATVVGAPSGVLREARVPAVRALPPMAAPLVERLSDRRTVYDFAEVMVGRVRARLTGPAGASVRVISGEQRGADGTVICDNFLVPGEAQVDTVTFEHAVDDLLWEPQFGYRGFRWIQIEVSGGATVAQVRAVPLYAEMERRGELRVAEPTLEWIDTALPRTFRNNLHGIPTDTPIYEKNGWTADAHLATEALLHHFDLREAFGKWMDDHVDAQGEDGSVPQIIPTPGWGRATDPTWSSSAVLIPWYLYREYGDRSRLERVAPMVRRFADHVLRGLDDDGLWRGRTWGDWLSPGHLVGPEGMAPIATVMTVTLLQHAALILETVGDDADGILRLRQAAARVGRAYHDTWFDRGRGIYAVDGVDYRQALNILPLAFGVVPDEHVDAVRAALIADIETRTDGHIDCGAVGVRHLLPVLSAAGRDDLAITVLINRSRPGWGAWFEAGESTLLESWDEDSRSRNHYFLGSVDAWIQQRVGGLRVTEPGWRRFEVAPVDDARIDRASIRHTTPRGEASVDWRRGPGGWSLDVTVPEGSEAVVRLAGTERTLGAGTHRVRIAT